MKKLSTSTIVIIIVVAILGIGGCSSYNGLVKGEESVTAAWAQVESQYQRRADLIPNLVATVKGYAEHESSTLQAVTEARNKATGITIDANNMTQEDLNRFQQAQDELGKSLGRLIAVSEAYPDLKANENFKDLQAQLEGTENRISVARQDFNKAAQAYNTSVRSFPKNIFASIFGFEKKAYFQAAAGSEEAPKVEF
ncbi:MAG: LemA family protein [Bacteroidales bacterium]|nr:LemA family protein [Bacteroidales bacterium]MBQ2090510.1 LemA family protein [Bacteroidales bacterium]MBQ7468593.1 LemA family protein [Bacteroidales bacterium]MCR5363834.1 LemA family protein [Bacteroidales bacterium]